MPKYNQRVNNIIKFIELLKVPSGKFTGENFKLMRFQKEFINTSANIPEFMINIQNLTVKNFMSVGNATQAINFDRRDLTLVLGENLDLGGDGSRNGTGKTTIINALSYALYGIALSNIKRDNLVNKTNGKNMIVSLDFAIGDQHEMVSHRYHQR